MEGYAVRPETSQNSINLTYGGAKAFKAFLNSNVERHASAV